MSGLMIEKLLTHLNDVKKLRSSETHRVRKTETEELRESEIDE